MSTTELTEILRRIITKHKLTPRAVYQAMIPIINEEKGNDKAPKVAPHHEAQDAEFCRSGS